MSYLGSNSQMLLTAQISHRSCVSLAGQRCPHTFGHLVYQVSAFFFGSCTSAIQSLTAHEKYQIWLVNLLTCTTALTPKMVALCTKKASISTLLIWCGCKHLQTKAESHLHTLNPMCCSTEQKQQKMCHLLYSLHFIYTQPCFSTNGSI